LSFQLDIFPNPAEGFSVNRAIPKSANGSTVLFSAVPFVLAKAKFGELLVIKAHESIPSHLGNDRSCRNAQTPTVPMLDDLLWDLRSDRKGAVNQQVIGIWPKIIHCHTHGQEGCLKDIDPVDFRRINKPYPYRDRLPIDRIEKLFSFLGAQFLGVIKMGEIELLREDDRCSHYRAGQRAPSGLIDPGNF